jgi:glycosyltransferase involved in cell wall biosynthesis
MKKILIVDHHAIHSPGRELYRVLGRTSGYDVKVMAPKVWTENGVTSHFEEEHEGLNIVSSRVLFKGKTHRNIYPRLAGQLHSFRPDILLVNSEPEGFLALQAVLLCSFLNLEPAIVFTTWRNMHYGEPGVPFPVKLPWLSRWIDRYTVPRCAHLIAHSPSASAIFRVHGIANISHIPPWVDLKRFAGTSTASEDSGDSERSKTPHVLQVGYVGRLVREKGVDVLLSAIRDLVVPAYLTIVGEGPEKEHLRKLASSGSLSDRCVFIPSVPQSEIPQVMSRFDVLVLPSRARPGWKEQFGRVLIEGMASGAVVVGSNSGDIPNVIGDAGLTFREGDSGALCAILRRLATSESLRNAHRAAGIRRVTEVYSLVVATQRYIALFDALKFKPELRRIEKTTP